jgi:integrase
LGLKNVVRVELSRHGQRTWELRTLDAEPIHAFTIFCDKNRDYSERTQKRYAETVSRFLDYLFEAGVFGREPVTARYLNSVIDAYPLLLRDGSEVMAAKVAKRMDHAPEDAWLAEVATALQWRPMKPASFSNTLAAVNRFLALSESLSLEASEHARVLGVDHRGRHERLIKALDGAVAVSGREIAQMRQNSMLGSVAKFVPKGIQRPRRLRASGGSVQSDQRNRDFPLAYVDALINAAQSWRDKALWLLLAASGIRTSEARNLLVDDVDFEEQQVWVLDPSGRRYAPPASVREQPRFKGRVIATTYLFPPLRQAFFKTLEQYFKHEYVPCSKPGQPRYLFQYIEPSRRGQPLVYASDAAMAKGFKTAVKAAGVPLSPSGHDWTPHSLRHLYGVYMLNDYPLAPERGKFGLELVEVQMLMGHASIRSTQVYARSKQHRLVTKLKASDEALLSLTHEETQLLPRGVIERLELGP